MSIIQEALRRKAEEEAAAAGRPAPPVGQSPVPTPPRRPPSRREERPRSRLAPWLILLLPVAAAGVIFGLAAMHRLRPQSTPGDATPPPETSPASSPAAQPPAAPAADSSRGEASDSAAANTNSPALPAAASSDVAAVPSSDIRAEVPVAPTPPPSEGDLENRAASTSAASSQEAIAWPSLELQGIVLRRPPHPSLVLINGRRLRVGDAIEGARVAEVEEDQVWMELQGQRRALRVGEPGE